MWHKPFSSETTYDDAELRRERPGEVPCSVHWSLAGLAIVHPRRVQIRLDQIEFFFFDFSINMR